MTTNANEPLDNATNENLEVQLSAAEAQLLADRLNQGQSLIEQAQINNNQLVAGAMRSIFESHKVPADELPKNIKDVSIFLNQQQAPTALKWKKPEPVTEPPIEVPVETPANGGSAPVAAPAAEVEAVLRRAKGKPPKR